jgi:hypothetical protein
MQRSDHLSNAAISTRNVRWGRSRLRFSDQRSNRANHNSGGQLKLPMKSFLDCTTARRQSRWVTQIPEARALFNGMLPAEWTSSGMAIAKATTDRHYSF